MIKTTIMLPEELHQKIKEYGFKNKLSLGEVVRQGVESFLGPISQESQSTDKPIVTPSERKESVISKMPEELKKTFFNRRGELDPDNYV